MEIFFGPAKWILRRFMFAIPSLHSHKTGNFQCTKFLNLPEKWQVFVTKEESLYQQLF